MKKVFWNLTMAAALLFTAGSTFVSCSGNDDDDNGVVNPEEPDSPDTPEKGAPFIIHADMDLPTPIEAYNMEAPGSERGVQVKVEEVTANNVKFTCVPGASARSYRIDIYPVATLYDNMFSDHYNEIVNEGRKLTTEETASYIEEKLFAAGGTGGYIISESTESNYADGQEYDWANSNFKQFEFYPDCEYVIVAQGCNDEEGVQTADMSICYFRTKPLESAKEYSLKFDLLMGWQAYGVRVTTQAPYYFVYTMMKDVYEQYINTFGEDLFRDMLRYFMTATPSADYPEVSWPIWADRSAELVVVGAAADENYVMGDLEVLTFTMVDIPSDAAPGTATFTLPEAETSPSVVNFHISMDANCSGIRYHWTTKDEYEKYTESDLQSLKAQIIDGGWYESNPNYKMDPDKLVPCGSAAEITSFQFGLNPDTEYVLMYSTINGYEQYSDLQTYSFKTKARFYDYYNWDWWPADFMMEASEIGTTSFSIAPMAEAQMDQIAVFYYMMVDMDYNVYDYENAALDIINSQDSYLQCMLDKDESNQKITFTGLEPGKDYKVVYVAECWNGDLTFPGEVTVHTNEAAVGGENPSISISASVQGEGDAKEFVGTFSYNEDVAKFRYETLEDDCTATTYADAVEYWKTHVLGEGGIEATAGDTWARAHVQVKYFQKRIVIVAVGIGADKDGNEVFSDPALAYYDVATGKIQTVSDIYPDAPKTSGSTKNMKVLSGKSKTISRTNGEVKMAAAKTVKTIVKAPAPEYHKGGMNLK
ncbi:hypothetical protein [uncultured Bacteroides sp.]|uniref:hypothetical protein n=1 Tax=uncultured Bacteroides sp. TaxID=162156 RepID=UPI002603465F|nr:hypothetical protein [uncultured Bacteroides sp.]